MIQRMLAIWSLVPLPFLKPAWISGSTVHILLKPGLENFEHYFTGMWDERNCAVVWPSLPLFFLRVTGWGLGGRRCKRQGFDPWVKKIPWRRTWQPTPVFFVWNIPWTKEPSGLQPRGLQKSRTWLSMHTMHTMSLGADPSPVEPEMTLAWANILVKPMGLPEPGNLAKSHQDS